MMVAPCKVGTPPNEITSQFTTVYQILTSGDLNF